MNIYSLIVSNTGDKPRVKPAELFERFKKDSPLKDSLGLGLSIVKTIADSYGFAVAIIIKSKSMFLKSCFRKSKSLQIHIAM